MNMTGKWTMTPDEWRGEVCMILRDGYNDPDLADIVGGLSDEYVHDHYQGMTPEEAARYLFENDSL